jgi:hypothetical protein
MIDYHFRNFTDQIEGFANEEFVTVFRDVSTDLKDGKSREAIHGMLVPNSEAKKESKKAQSFPYVALLFLLNDRSGVNSLF